MLDKRKIIITVLIVILVVILIVNLVSKKEIGKTEETVIENNVAKSDVVVEDIEFKEITKEFKNGITTISAKVYNTTNEVKNIKIKIILKDENGKELTNMMQVLENIEPDKVKILTTGLSGDYTKVTDIKFEIVN
jgi:regulatory protein YycI of two-component signal transduction system YycFG